MDSRNRELLEYSTKLFDEIYMSTGTSTFEEVRESAYYIYKKINEIKNSNKHLILLHCVSCYPCQVENSNLPRIEKLKELCNSVGLSDHTEGIEVAKMALEYGIDVIEKHFTTDKTLPGRDNQFAILPEEMKELKTYITLREKANVDLGLDYQEIEKGTRENYSGRWDA
jgi:N-acetylneuraminate synthase/N,N'-diacetyllegionaminate synthase